MSYTPEELRQRAAKIDAANAFMDSKNRALANEPAKQLLAHADALDEIESLKAKLKVAEVALADLIPLAETAMHGMNNNGGEYDVAGELEAARAALAAIREAK